ncbi:MAG: restriction endonuclease subunit S [Lachnospiraceae bacterium]|nr:restriction endonuclease subunit S [Lachnospiraceae bacterium]
MAKLIDITGKALSGEWGTDDETGDGIPVLRTTNFTNEGIVNYNDVVTRTITKKNIEEKFLRKGDIIIEKSGGSDKFPVGRVIYFDGKDDTYLFNNFTGLLRVRNQEVWYPRYVFYSLFANYKRGGTRAFENKTTGLHNLKTDDYVSRYEIAETDREKQVLISEKLDKLYGIIQARKQELQKLDELIKARFVEMFGDMYLNTMAWREIHLETMADIVSGITKGRKAAGKKLTKVPYMAVSNVKDGYIDWTTVKTIEATDEEINQYRLLPDDVLMTEGGDPDKLGRGAIIRTPLKNCIHQNHIFRVRLDESHILPDYFAQYLKHQRAKRYFLRCAKQTTGIASINMKQLKALPVLLPPLELQNEFATFVKQVDKSKVAVQKALDNTQLLFDSLMQQYFG